MITGMMTTDIVYLYQMNIPFLKSIFHNIGVILVGLFVGFIGLGFDAVLKIQQFHSLIFTLLALFLFVIGFVLRVWATYLFYIHNMKVIALKAQSSLITTGPYRISRNPLYLGGNVFIFFGAAFLFGSPSAIVITIIGIFATHMMILREEKQLEKKFGVEWLRYRGQVRRWI